MTDKQTNDAPRRSMQRDTQKNAKVKVAVNRLVRRFVAKRTRRRKARYGREWLHRWNAACAKSWRILTNGPMSRERFERWERNHKRLCRLIERTIKLKHSPADRRHEKSMKPENNIENTAGSDCPAASGSASFPLCPRCRHSKAMELNPCNLRYACKSCGTTWSQNYLKGWNDGNAGKQSTAAPSRERLLRLLFGPEYRKESLETIRALAASEFNGPNAKVMAPPDDGTKNL